MKTAWLMAGGLADACGGEKAANGPLHRQREIELIEDLQIGLEEVSVCRALLAVGLAASVALASTIAMSSGRSSC